MGKHIAKSSSLTYTFPGRSPSGWAEWGGIYIDVSLVPFEECDCKTVVVSNFDGHLYEVNMF